MYYVVRVRIRVGGFKGRSVYRDPLVSYAAIPWIPWGAVSSVGEQSRSAGGSRKEEKRKELGGAVRVYMNTCGGGNQSVGRECIRGEEERRKRSERGRMNERDLYSSILPVSLIRSFIHIFLGSQGGTPDRTAAPKNRK